MYFSSSQLILDFAAVAVEHHNNKRIAGVEFECFLFRFEGKTFRLRFVIVTVIVNPNLLRNMAIASP